MDLALKFQRCAISPILPEEQRAKISGTFAGETRIIKSLGNDAAPSAEGSVSSEALALKNLPILKKLAAFTGEDRFLPLQIDELAADYQSEGSVLKIRNLVAESSRLVRVEGGLTHSLKMFNFTVPKASGRS